MNESEMLNMLDMYFNRGDLSSFRGGFGSSAVSNNLGVFSSMSQTPKPNINPIRKEIVKTQEFQMENPGVNQTVLDKIMAKKG